MSCYAIRLQPGQELKSALADFTSTHKIRVRGPGMGPVHVCCLLVCGCNKLSRTTLSCVARCVVYFSTSFRDVGARVYQLRQNGWTDAFIRFVKLFLVVY